MAWKPRPKKPPNTGTKCSQCNGKGTVLVNPNDRREGEKRCGRCVGNGEL